MPISLRHCFRPAKTPTVVAQIRRRPGLILAGCLLLLSQTPVVAQAATPTRPYDAKLYRLAEILGAVHYLRELCEANDGQKWREQMKALLAAEGSTAVRRARLTRSFNNGYRSYSRTYVNCTPSAKSAISKFLVEGVEISESLIKPKP